MLWVGCGNEEGKTNRWTIFVEAEHGFFRKLFKHYNVTSTVTLLENQLEDVVRNENLSKDIEWEYTYEA